MNVFIWASKGGTREAETLRDSLYAFAGGGLQLFETLDGLAERLRRPKDPLSIVVVISPSVKDLEALIDLREHALGVRILLILPDQKKETLALAHKVFPSYIGYRDGYAPRIVSVIMQLAKAQSENPQAGERAS